MFLHLRALLLSSHLLASLIFRAHILQILQCALEGQLEIGWTSPGQRLGTGFSVHSAELTLGDG